MDILAIRVRIAIGELRRTLGDTAQASRYIATVQRRGYRFVAPVVEHTAAVPGPTGAPPLETPVTPHPHEVVPLARALPLPTAERRHLTVLFCDLVGSTPLAGRLDQEDYREVVRAYHQVCAEVMQRFDGYLAQYLGDGVLVYFGYPVAHEDDAQRAVRAGLDVLDACASLSTHPALPAGHQVAVRLGVHTGLVVVGDVGAGTRHALTKLPKKLAAIPSPVCKALRSKFHTLWYRARQRKGLRVFALGQRLRHFVDYVTTTAGAANGQRVRRWFQEKKAGWYAVLEDPRMPVTSTLLDQAHNAMERKLFMMKGFHHPKGSQQAFLTGLAHLYNLVPYQRRAQHAGQCGVEVEGGRVPTRDWLLNLQILTSGGFR